MIARSLLLHLPSVTINLPRSSEYVLRNPPSTKPVTCLSQNPQVTMPASRRLGHPSFAVALVMDVDCLLGRQSRTIRKRYLSTRAVFGGCLQEFVIPIHRWHKLQSFLTADERLIGSGHTKYGVYPK